MSSTYVYRDSVGTVLYVGMTDRGSRRMEEHASTKSWWSRAAACYIEHHDTREQALAREADLIATLMPIYNEQLSPLRDIDVEERMDALNKVRKAVVATIKPIVKTRAAQWRPYVAQANRAGLSMAVAQMEDILSVPESHNRPLSSGEQARIVAIVESLGWAIPAEWKISVAA